MAELQKLIEKHDLIFDSENQHFHCFSHVINLVVQDLLKRLKVEEEKLYEENYKSDGSNDDVDSDCEDAEDRMTDKLMPVLAKLRATCKKLRKSEQLTSKFDQY